MSNITHLSEDRAYPCKDFRPGPIDLGLQWQPSAVHVAIVSTIHTVTLGAVSAAVLLMVGVFCIWMGA